MDKCTQAQKESRAFLKQPWSQSESLRETTGSWTQKVLRLRGYDAIPQINSMGEAGVL